MDLDEKAEETPDVELARQSAPGVYRLKDTELVPADELTAEGEFPKYGDYLPVERTTGGSNPEWGPELYVECPQGLAQWLVERDLGEGDAFRILTVKKVDGVWKYECEPFDLDEHR